MSAISDDVINAICARLLDSEEHAVEAAIPAIAEDAVELIQKLASERNNLQATIDALMLEYCPDEMTPAQKANWEAHQVPAEPGVEAFR